MSTPCSVLDRCESSINIIKDAQAEKYILVWYLVPTYCKNLKLRVIR